MSSVTTTRGVTYARHEGIDLAFDLHVPSDVGGPLPLAIFIHGGGWLRGARTDGEQSRQIPVASTGIAVATIDYRLSGQALWPAQLVDVRAAIREVPRIAAGIGVALDGRVALWGCSAGGHLALMAALTASLDDPIVDSIVAWFPTTDLEQIRTAPTAPDARQPAFLAPGAPVPAFERLLLGLQGEEDASAALRQASPITHVREGLPPILLVHGDQDAFVATYHSLSLADALAEKGGDVATLLVHGATHDDPLFDVPAVHGATAATLKGRA